MTKNEDIWIIKYFMRSSKYFRHAYNNNIKEIFLQTNKETKINDKKAQKSFAVCVDMNFLWNLT